MRLRLRAVEKGCGAEVNNKFGDYWTRGDGTVKKSDTSKEAGGKCREGTVREQDVVPNP